MLFRPERQLSFGKESVTGGYSLEGFEKAFNARCLFLPAVPDAGQCELLLEVPAFQQGARGLSKAKCKQWLQKNRRAAISQVKHQALS